ncbi:MAG: very short patch repair endonuclease [Ignavibacteria bacterium]|nr:very short patch repair endonuclease [Ignavibacteria bacterium]
MMTKEQISYVMSTIKSKNTKPELSLRKALWISNLKGYRLKSKLKGRPDIIYSKKKLAIFVDGCFWHMCPVHFKQPRSNVEYWGPKFQQNKKRDENVNENLKREGWKVLRFWEHDIQENLESCVKDIEIEYHRK